MVNVTAAEDTEALLLNIRRVLEPCSKVCPYHVRLVRNLLALCAGKNLQLSRPCAAHRPKIHSEETALLLFGMHQTHRQLFL